MSDDRQEEAERNRALMPEFASFVDALRRWAPGSIVVWAEEGGVRLGAQPPWDEARSMNADEWLHWTKTGELPAGKVSPHAKGGGS